MEFMTSFYLESGLSAGVVVLRRGLLKSAGCVQKIARVADKENVARHDMRAVNKVEMGSANRAPERGP